MLLKWRCQTFHYCTRHSTTVPDIPVKSQAFHYCVRNFTTYCAHPRQPGSQHAVAEWHSTTMWKVFGPGRFARVSATVCRDPGWRGWLCQTFHHCVGQLTNVPGISLLSQTSHYCARHSTTVPAMPLLCQPADRPTKALVQFWLGRLIGLQKDVVIYT